MDYQTLNQAQYTNTALDSAVSPYEQGYSDGLEGYQPDDFLQQDAGYRKGYTTGIKILMTSIANKQRSYIDPSNGFDWF